MSGSGGQRTDKQAARRTARVHNRWAVFWFANIPPVVASYFVLGRDLWQALMLVYLAVVSIWANAATHLARAGAAKAEEASFEHPGSVPTPPGRADPLLGDTTDTRAMPPTTRP